MKTLTPAPAVRPVFRRTRTRGNITRSAVLAALLCLAAGGAASAQQREGADSSRAEPGRAVGEQPAPPGPNLRVIARGAADSIVLRWAATTHAAWQQLSRAGVHIERSEIGPGGVIDGTTRILTTAPLRPLSVDEWKARYAADDTLAAAAVEALYGAPIVQSTDRFGQIYEMYTQQSMMHGFAMALADLAPRIADGLGLRYVDRDVRGGGRYLYRLLPAESNPDVPVDTGGVLARAVAPDTLPVLDELTVTEGEKHVVLEWNRFEDGGSFTAWHVESSLDGRRWERLTHFPLLGLENPAQAGETWPRGLMRHRVDLLANYLPVRYRVRGVTAFGEWSPPSDGIVAMGRDRTPPAPPVIARPEILPGGDIRISWSVSVEDRDIAGFTVGRGPTEEGPFEAESPQLGPDARSWTHVGVRDEFPYFYIVAAVDTAGNMMHSVPVLAVLPDSIPPAVPSGLTGVIDTTGVVTLRWKANTELDLRGYRVFFANAPDHEYQQLTTTITRDTVFVDTLMLATLTRDIYYRVVALDENFNHSAFSPALHLIKPDRVPPAAPLFTDARSDEQGIVLAWTSSPSTDVVRIELLRREEGGGEWRMLHTVPSGAAGSLVDSTARVGANYEYTLQAVDGSGLRSRHAMPVGVRRYDSGVRPPVLSLTATLTDDRNAVQLRWQPAPGLPGDAHYLLTRSVDGGSPSAFVMVPAGAREHRDTDAPRGVRIVYGIRVVTDDGGESALVSAPELQRP